MAANVLDNPIFTDEAKAREWLEARVWPTGPVCPHCGAVSERVTKLEGKEHRPGLYQCNECREQFTVTVRTVFERSKIPLTKWLAALFLMTASKKGVSAHQVHRMLGVSYKSTWFMMHRLREAMRKGGLAPMGSDGGVVEIDETFIGRKRDKRVRTGYEHKHAVLSLIDRTTGEARSFHIDRADTKNVIPVVRANLAKEARAMTDEAGQYKHLHKDAAKHHFVRHAQGEYGRGEIHTNTIEGYFSIFKRGMKGVYQHCSEKHLHRYLAEFDFRYSNRAAFGVDDYARAERLAVGIKGKRLTYRRPHQA